MGQPSDEELLEKFSDPETRNYAFNLLVRKYQERLYWYIRKIVVDHDDANDVIQNTFIKAWRSLEKFRGDAGLYTWLYRIATNESLTFLKKKKKQLKISVEEFADHLANTLEADAYGDGDEMKEKLDKAILQLPEKQRIVFTLKYFEDKKYSEIAQILDTSEGALKASYHHAVKKIESFLTGD